MLIHTVYMEEHIGFTCLDCNEYSDDQNNPVLLINLGINCTCKKCFDV